MGLIETDAIILRNLRLGESDKVVIALTRQAGVVRGVAKGARRLKSKFGASLEPFTLVRLTFFEKEARELVSISNTEIITSHFELTGSDTVFVTLEYLANLILEFAPLRDPDDRYYRMMRACLDTLARNPDSLRPLTTYFEIWTLKPAGFLPDLERCTICKGFLIQTGTRVRLRYDSAMECSKCTGGGGLEIDSENLRHWAKALRVSPETWAANTARSTESSVVETGQLLHRLITRALEREPKLRPPVYSA